MRVKAAVARAYRGPLAIADLDLEDPREGEVFVRMIACGVALRDREAIAGKFGTPLPFVPGCEGAGIVERVGAGVVTPMPGEAVLIAGVSRRSEETIGGTRADGSAPYHAIENGDLGEAINGFFSGQSAFGTHVLCPAELAVPVSDDAPLELLAGLGREVLLGAGVVLERCETGTEATIVITGGDAVGLGACMAAAMVGFATIVVADPRESRRELALKAGATIAVPADEGLGAVVKSLVADGATYAIETSGSADALAACEASLGKEGRCIAVTPDDLQSLDIGSLVGQIVAAHGEGRFPLEELVAYFPFEQVNDALDAHARGDVPKPVLRFSLGKFGAVDRALQEGAAKIQDTDGSQSEPTGTVGDREREAPKVTA